MIYDNPSMVLKEVEKRRYIEAGVLVDTNVLIIYFLNKFCILHSDKEYILRNCSIERRQINCLNAIIQNFRIKRLIITPHILVEFLNFIKNRLKVDYKEITKEILDELIAIDEILIAKNPILTHKDFIDFGNDISLLLATKEHIKSNKYSTLMSFDSRFINKFFEYEDNILAFNMEVLSYQISPTG